MLDGMSGEALWLEPHMVWVPSEHPETWCGSPTAGAHDPPVGAGARNSPNQRTSDVEADLDGSYYEDFPSDSLANWYVLISRSI